jgi:hypothetical protein
MRRYPMSTCPVCEKVIFSTEPTTWRIFHGESTRVHGMCVEPPVTRRPVQLPEEHQ